MAAQQFRKAGWGVDGRLLPSGGAATRRVADSGGHAGFDGGGGGGDPPALVQARLPGRLVRRNSPWPALWLES
jgi:hypothetical protein